jgi:ABC-2 type transport system ATP-binding protein
VNEALQLDGIRKTLAGREVLKGISFTVARGDVFGYLGSNGAGKTTTIRILLDLIRATSGEVRVMGESASRDEVRRRIGFVLEADGLYNALSAVENLQFYARIYGAKDARARIGTLLADVGLADRARDRVGGFSKGMRQRLAFARALVHDPQVLILDEPMSGIDPSGQIELRRILLDVVRRGGKTIFFSSHDLDEVQRICNRIALIDQGTIRLQGELATLMREMGGHEVVIDTAGATPEAVLSALRDAPRLGFQTATDERLVFSPAAGVAVSDVVGFLVGRGVKVEGARRKEASLEELYTAILREREGAQ